MSEFVVDLTGVQTKAVKDLSSSDALAYLWGLPVREQIVRCRDCEHFEQGYTDGVMFDETVCWAWENGHDYPSYTNPNGFCYRGKRRGSE